MQKFRADKAETQPDGATVCYSIWMGGPTLARVNNCRWESLANEPRITAYATGHADTYFSIPAVCSYKGRRVVGYLTGDGDGNTVFRHTTYRKG